MRLRCSPLTRTVAAFWQLFVKKFDVFGRFVSPIARSARDKLMIPMQKCVRVYAGLHYVVARRPPRLLEIWGRQSIRGPRVFFVKLFDTFAGLNAIDEPADAEKPTVADHGDDLQRVGDVG